MLVRPTILRDAWRALRAAPLVSGLAVVSLALGIGANTALFSIVNSLLLKTLPVHEPAQLVYLTKGSWTNPIWEQIRSRDRELFAGAFAWSAQRFNLAPGGEVDPVEGAYASGAVFNVLGVSAIRGRVFTEQDDARGGGPDGAVAVISHRLWQQRFDGAEDILSRTVNLQRVPVRIIGVMPKGFSGPDVGRVIDVIVPIGVEPIVRGAESYLDARSTWWLDIIVRMKPDQTLVQANAALRAIQPGVRAETIPPKYPAEAKDRYLTEPWTLAPASTGLSQLRSRYEQPLLAILVVVGLVLLIACANIASLLLARATARRRELSVRLALGASRGQLVRQLLVESLLLAVTGAVVGVLLAQWGSQLLVAQLTTWRTTVLLDLSLDWRVLGFTAGLAILTAVVCGLAPAWTATRVSPGEVLKATSRGVMGDRRLGVRGALVVAQVALSLVLLVAAGLFLRTFASLNRVSLGFSPAPILLVQLNLQPSTVKPADRLALITRLQDAITAAAGVAVAPAHVITPLTGEGWNTGVGAGFVDDRSRMSWVNAVSPGWFHTYGLRLLAGRDFDAGDRPGGSTAVVVNETFARRFLPDGSPIGQRFQSGNSHYEVVGLVNDAVYRSLREGAVPTMYQPVSQQERIGAGMTLSVDTRGADRTAARKRIADAVTAVDPRVSVTFRTFDDLIGAVTAQERLVAVLAAAFGVVALLLSAVGLYGTVAYAVGRRRTELGLRLALGARPAGLVNLVLARAGVLQVAGVAIGIGISWWASQLVSALLFNVEARDWPTLAGAAVVLLTVGMLAAVLPARRIAKIDPATVLRDS